MNTILKVFRYVAFLNIPFLLLAIYLIYEPLFTDGTAEQFQSNFSLALIFMGFGFTFTSLRDVKKIDKMGRFVIERPVFMKALVLITTVISLITIAIGLYITFVKDTNSQLGIGMVSFGLGYMAMVKSLIDQTKDLTDHYD